MDVSGESGVNPALKIDANSAALHLRHLARR